MREEKCENERGGADQVQQYTYYTVTAFKIPVPMFVKRTLTSMQITQFLVGASCAMVHSFINYTIPVISASETVAPASASAVANGSLAAGAAGVLNSVKGTYVRRTMACITSSGPTFAIWLNVLYLAPLTYLFVSFFIESYIRRSNAASKQTGKKGTNGTATRRLSNVQMAEKAGWEAAKNIEREVYGEGNEEAVVTETTKVNGRVLRSRH